jgi:hypothetical protein
MLLSTMAMSMLKRCTRKLEVLTKSQTAMVCLQRCSLSTDAASTSDLNDIETTSHTKSKSCSPDPFLSHLQHKTESELIELLGGRQEKSSTVENDEGHENVS